LSYRQLRPKQLVEPGESKLSDRPLVLIGRQSSTRQIEENTESLRLQIEDARQRFISQGWSEDIITIRVAGDGKKGVSGTLRIDQRAELRDTMIDIKAGICKAVGAYSVSRLFRDKHGVQVSVFIETCAKHDCLVILPDKTYDFNRQDDITMFTILARFAAVENEQRAKLLSDAKRRKSLRGEFDGRTLTPGFIVDREKDSPTYGKYLEYPPHAEVTRKLYARFRKLAGQFTVLAAEVAAMDVVFPDFEAWVSPLDVHRCMLKKVPGGYHISRVALLHLLTAVEYVGYWKVDGELLVDADGIPVKNHAAIVPFDDWEYAFTRLSFTTLDGLANTDRTHGTSWTPANRAETRNVLAGILVSPLGKVQNSGGLYRVVEQRPGHSQPSATLAIDARLIDSVWYERLRDRMVEIDNYKFFNEQLRKLKEQHAKELVSVPEQLARYYKERAGIQAYIKAVGATADKATLQQYNEDLLQLTANINELEAKQLDAATEEERVTQLRDRTKRLKELLGVGGRTEHSTRFIRLATDKIILDEYSSHFLTLTIMWSAPFQQVDRCYIYRPGGSHQQWSGEDEEDFRRLYPEADRSELLQRFPTRTWVSLLYCAQRLGLRRSTDLNTSGITDRSLSLADWQLVQQHGWELPEEGYGRYWLYDVANDLLESSSEPEMHRKVLVYLPIRLF
jgi:DNA invertase Pin-like site-specific DNA recombinase